MIHSFDVELAKEKGIIIAIMLQSFSFWIKHNEANKKNFHEGRYWTYNSLKALEEIFPYLTKRQIEYNLNKMIEDNIIVKGNFNKNQYDRTNWYTLTDYGKSISHYCEMESTIMGNGIHSSVKPIPVNKTINKTIICNKQKQKTEIDAEAALEASWKEICTALENEE